MEREAFDSSVIASAGYDAAVQTLEVEFASGEIYRYRLVPRRVWRELRDADSAGAYFNAVVRDRYPEEWMPHGATPAS
ncbi:KTSC domain-containing protein [Leifsonia sp. fls2-241-R2A-40a]|uniref:KTSC domain-containing protein n=1 Tax=Leifsonia sp. fls2-241-R2A-40a TaxID=3040290 RepID=UPI00254D6AAA|nr:KTSC domain-containing protein [Leifsonia sp. fls2-241-R2A-40a]